MCIKQLKSSFIIPVRFMTSACQKRDGEVTKSAHHGDGRPEEWGHGDVSFPGGDGQRSDGDDDEAERLQEGYDVNKVCTRY